MFIRSIKPVFLCLTFAVGVLFAVVLHAHGGLSMADDMCKLTIGPYTMHFTGYQPDSSQEKEFCEDIPATGRTMVALDYIEEALRPLPTEVRVIKDTGSEENLDAITVLHIPSKVYPNGSINFEHKFNEPGKFVGLVTVAGGGRICLTLSILGRNRWWNFTFPNICNCSSHWCYRHVYISRT